MSLLGPISFNIYISHLFLLSQIFIADRSSNLARYVFGSFVSQMSLSHCKVMSADLIAVVMIFDSLFGLNIGRIELLTSLPAIDVENESPT